MTRQQNPFAGREWEDLQWSQRIDNAVILMSLLITRAVFRRFKGPRRVRDRVATRLDRLITFFKDHPDCSIAHDAQSPYQGFD